MRACIAPEDYVTVNSTERTLLAAPTQDCQTLFSGVDKDIILVLLTQNKNVRVDKEDVRDSRVKKIFPILVNNRWDSIAENGTNQKCFDEILRFLTFE